MRRARSSRSDAKPKAQGDLSDATATLRILVEEKDEAAREAADADDRVKAAAERVITLDADAIATDLIAARQRATDLHRQLLGLSYVSRGYGVASNQPWPLTQNILTALQWVEPLWPGHANPIHSATRSWTSYRDALAQNADATLTNSR